MTRLQLGGWMVLIVLVTACDPVEYTAVRSAMAAAPEVELLALGQEVSDPDRELTGEWVGDLPRYPVLGHAVLRSAERDAVLDALDHAVDGASGITYRCFEPHHALRRGGDAGTLVPICFQCSALRAPGLAVQLEIGDFGELQRLLDAALLRDAHLRFVPDDREHPWVAAD